MGVGALTRRRAIFLDRDGVLNATIPRTGGDGPPWQVEDFHLLPGVREACFTLAAAGWSLIVVTNQPDVRRGQLSLHQLEAMHHRLRQWLPLQAVEVCLHDDADHCLCRKPLPGMLLQAAQRHNIALGKSWMVGDRCKDVLAGKAAKVRTVLVAPAGATVDCHPTHTAVSLPAAIPYFS